MDSIQKMDDVLFRAPPNVEDPPAIQKLLAAIEQARTLARVPYRANELSNLFQHVNAYQRDIQFQIGDSAL
jgi:hypothetical protein